MSFFPLKFGRLSETIIIPRVLDLIVCVDNMGRYQTWYQTCDAPTS